MIFGIGTDIVQIARVRRMWERHGERAAARILAPDERAQVAHTGQPERLLAKRFAAKEAFGKALGTGVRVPATLHSLAVTHDAEGRPRFAYAPGLAAHMRQRGLVAHLSISDEAELAVAFVVIEHHAEEA